MQSAKIPGIELQTELGRGAHSVVYKAVTVPGNVACAVKLPQTRARWTREIYREAVALARAKHTGLPEVLEVGEVEGLPYLVMELVEGDTLAASLADGPLDTDDVIGIGEQLASILAAVHDIGLVHRDVKPRNIVVDPTGTLKLVDFGFTTPMERTGAGDTAGTALYAAPEQLTPPGRVDGRSDLYCVGRVLLECLVGPSFSVFRTNAETITELAGQGAPLGLVQIVGHLLQVEPSSRYPDAHALASELERVRRNRPILGPTGYTHDRGGPTTIARVRERQEVVDWIRGTRDSGRSILVCGSRGSGKSRLIDAVAREVGRTIPTVVVSSTEDDAPLAELRRILESVWVTTSIQTHALTTAELVDVLGNLAPIAALISPRLGRELDLPDEAHLPDATDALSEGAAEILLRIARKLGRLAIIVDDIQWMDLASTSALVRVAYRIAEAPLALVLGSRSETPRTVLERFLAVRGIDVPMTELDLWRLDEVGVARLVASHLATQTIDPLVVARIAALADGSPLGVLEVLGAFLDVGALRPHARGWLFDAAKLEAISLPSGTLTLLGRRLNELPPATRRVLEAAAICGTAWSESRVAALVDVPVTTIEYASVVAQRAGLIEATEADHYRFVHDSLRESLVEDLSLAERGRLHQRLGEIISEQREPTFEDLIAAARHLAAGIEGKDPARVLRVATAAALAAHARFDDEVALDLHKQAVAAAACIGTGPSTELHLVAAEARLRLGAVQDSIGSFERALAQTTKPTERARILGRIAWAYETNAEPERAWDSLARAFLVIGERLPTENVASVASTTTQLARAHYARLLGGAPAARAGRDVELLCQLHYQNGRLAFEYGKVGRIVQSGLVAHSLSAEASSRATKARALAINAATMAAFGRVESGQRDALVALQLAKDSGDATAAAFCTQMLGMAANLGGDFEQSILNFQDLVATYGPWAELPEFCLQVMSIDLMLTMQGRPDEAWHWLEKAIARVRRTRTTSRTMVCVIHRARALLATLDRMPAPESWLGQQFSAISLSDGGTGYHRIMSWAPRATFYVETDDIGPELDELMTEFDAEKINPRFAHMAVIEYYIAVVTARTRQCFRANESERPRRIRELAKAASALRLAARAPSLVPHALVADAYVAWFSDDAKKAHRLLAEAEQQATRENLPWVLSNAAHARGRFLAAVGKGAAARDQARVAQTLAIEHGAQSRARLIREEFGLAASVLALPASNNLRASGRSSSSRTTRQLAALIHVAKGTRRDMKAEEHAALILDELLRSMEAERGSIWFQPEVPSLGTAVTRNRRVDASSSIAPDSPLGTLLRDVHRSGISWPSNDPANDPSDVIAFDHTRMHVVPLHLYEQPVGALSMERGPKQPPFAPEDRQLLELLSHQVPIALEIARLLSVREQLHHSLQQAQKMEAIGQLAGGLAHDFNNMLAAMKVALGSAQEHVQPNSEMAEELEIIAQATTRASQLTSQLLSFARNQPLPVSMQDVNQQIVKLEPMLRRVGTDGIEVALKLSPAVDAVEIDPGSFDQVLMNLLINARDAMPKGGKFAIGTRNVVLDEHAAVRAHVTPGQYVEVEVSDTGEGMTPEVQARIFEPFYTTKPAGRGTGLGLATVYGFAKNCGGGIEVQSEVAVGTTFRLYLKRAERPKQSRPAFPRRSSTTSAPAAADAGPDTILVIDDDDLVRRSIAKILERHGYRVIAANGSAEAMDVARAQGKRVGLVILDVMLPGVTGPELGRRLGDLGVAAKLLFVSGFSAESAPIEDAKVNADMLLQKPFSQSALLERVRRLMPAPGRPISTSPSS